MSSVLSYYVPFSYLKYQLYLGTICTRPYVQRIRFVSNSSEISEKRTNKSNPTLHFEKNLHTVQTPRPVTTGSGQLHTAKIATVSPRVDSPVVTKNSDIRDTVIDIRSAHTELVPTPSIPQTNISDSSESEALKIYNTIKKFDSTIDESLGTLNKKTKKNLHSENRISNFRSYENRV